MGAWHAFAAAAALTVPLAAGPVPAGPVPAGPVAAGPVAAGPVAGAQRRLRQVSYRGYSFDVPGSWPVIDLARHPRDCVRMDRHAVYLGTPGRDQSCPSRLIGTTEAVVIGPAAARVPRASVEDPVARTITAAAPGIRVTATFGDHSAEIYQILASALLPAPVIEAPDPVSSGRAAGQPRRALRARVASYHGLGFDTCTAPSAAYMRAWRARSRYRAVGIYIGGADAACAQPNLTGGWLRREAAAGWRFLPLYVGPQAEFRQLSARPGRQGHAAADDAVMRARLLGLGPGTPLYYDMEAYPAGQAGTVLRFLSAWTRVLHALGYASGVYSSSSSGIADLARHYSGRRYAMPDVIDDALWNGRAGTRDSVYRSGEWAHHRRVHQFAGNVLQTFGGDTLDIDQDYLNVRARAPAR